MTTLNVREYGAVGDGAADDTAALRRAVAALPEQDGVLWFPPGHYRTDTLRMPSFATLRGESAWAYSHREPGGTVLLPLRADQPCLIDAGGTRGTRLVGLTLRGTIAGDNPGDGGWPEGPAMDGIRYDDGCDMTVIDGCRIERFSGAGVALRRCGVWEVRHSLLLFNRGHGLDAESSPDGWVLDTMLAANGGAGITVGASVTITGCRIEHNARAGLRFNPGYAAAVQVTGNLFCCNHGPAIEHDGNIAEGIAISGNTLRRLTDLPLPDDPGRQCLVRLINMQGLAFTGNALYCDRQVTRMPAAMILGRLTDSVVSGNTLFHAATETLIRDEGGHAGTVIGGNPGRVLGE